MSNQPSQDYTPSQQSLKEKSATFSKSASSYKHSPSKNSMLEKRFIYYIPYNFKENEKCDLSFLRKKTKNRMSQYKQLEEDDSEIPGQDQSRPKRERSREKKRYRDLSEISKDKDKTGREKATITKEEAFRKTKICPLFERGRCTKGDQCKYAHSYKQMKEMPDLRKTKLCIGFKEGNCFKRSDQCKYAHGWKELRKVPKIVDKNAEIDPHFRHHFPTPVSQNSQSPGFAPSYDLSAPYSVYSSNYLNQGSQYLTPYSNNCSPYMPQLQGPIQSPGPLSYPYNPQIKISSNYLHHPTSPYCFQKPPNLGQ